MSSETDPIPVPELVVFYTEETFQRQYIMEGYLAEGRIEPQEAERGMSIMVAILQNLMRLAAIERAPGDLSIPFVNPAPYMNKPIPLSTQIQFMREEVRDRKKFSDDLIKKGQALPETVAANARIMEAILRNLEGLAQTELFPAPPPPSHNPPK